MSKKISIAFFLLLPFNLLFAQEFSYVYIQGDKATPFYVKLEDEMLPRYGKNYCIISKLEPGEIHLEILFQQNIFPAEHFTIKVPEQNSRNFLLIKKDNVYALYDLQQNFYLLDGNTAADDMLPSAIVTAATETTKMPVTKLPEETSSKHAITFSKKEDKEPNFIGDIELNNKKTIGDAQAIEKNIPATVIPVKNETPAKSLEEEEEDINAVVIPNSDCPEPVSNDVLEIIYKKAMQQNTEEARLGYLNSHMNNCYATEQVRILAKSLDTDAARYAFLKKVYPRITNQAKFAALQDILDTEQWKEYFAQMLKK